jgi:hypothetical protein
LREYLEVEWKRKHGGAGADPKDQPIVVAKEVGGPPQSGEDGDGENGQRTQCSARTPMILSRERIKGHNVLCPQQDNFSDCGVYLLQYVESFFVGDKRIADFRIPFKGLKEWFSSDRMRRKRKDISELFLKLCKECNPDVAERIPKLEFDCDAFDGTSWLCDLLKRQLTLLDL